MKYLEIRLCVVIIEVISFIELKVEIFEEFLCCCCFFFMFPFFGSYFVEILAAFNC